MQLKAPKLTVSNWYDDVSLSLQLMESFIDGVEDQAEKTYERFENERQTIIIEESPEEDYVSIVEFHQGLDNVMWDLRGIFKEYFPSLQRRSALLTIFGFFEHELDKLCLLYKSEKSFKLALSDLGGKGINRAVSYLNKVAEIEVHTHSKEWDRIQNIQKLRNVIVHQDGKLHDHQGKPKKAVIDYINQTDTLSGKEEILISKGFLSHVVDIFRKYLNKIQESIVESENA